MGVFLEFLGELFYRAFQGFVVIGELYVRLLACCGVFFCFVGLFGEPVYSNLIFLVFFF